MGVLITAFNKEVTVGSYGEDTGCIAWSERIFIELVQRSWDLQFCADLSTVTKAGNILMIPLFHSTPAPLAPSRLSHVIVSRKPVILVCCISSCSWLLVSLSVPLCNFSSYPSYTARNTSFLRWGQWSSVGCKLGGGANNQEQEPCVVKEVRPGNGCV